MCFILNLFNSCSFKRKSKSSNKKSNNNNNSISNNKPESITKLANNNTIISSCSISSHSSPDLNEKTFLKNNANDLNNFNQANKNSSEAAKLRDKFFKTKLVYSKLESPDPEHIKNIHKEAVKNEELKRFNKIIDYCNYCGYYCCECNIEASDKTNKNFSFYINLSNSFVNKLINTDNTQELTNISNISSPSTLKRMKSTNSNNSNNSINVNININKKMNDFPMLSSQTSFSSESSNTTLRQPNNFNQIESFNNYSPCDDVEMKSEDDYTNTTFNKMQHHIPVTIEKPTLNLFSNRFDNIEMKDKTPFLSPKPKKAFLGPPGILTSRQPELKLEQLPTKKTQYVFQSSQFLFAKPDRELSEILDKEINNYEKEEERNEDESPASPHRPPHNQHGIDNSGKKHRRSRTNRNGKIIISKDQIYEFKESDLQDLGQIGYGEFGTVHKVIHKPSQTCMALKRIRPTVGSQGERKKVLKELDFVLECQDYTHVVKFYGVKLNNEPAENLICMELMDTSLEKFYKFVYEKKKEEIPEIILIKIIIATVNALNYLKESHKIIHRDVKPSNILVNKHGDIKMCDFGISGKLVDSIAASRDAGCQLYMAPERIDPSSCTQGYDVRSDIWSLGITLYELSTGRFPYPQWKTIFHQLNLVVDSDAPRLEAERLSKDFCNFVNTCLTKDERKRPKYKELLQHPLIQSNLNSSVNVSQYVTPYIKEMQRV